MSSLSVRAWLTGAAWCATTASGAGCSSDSEFRSTSDVAGSYSVTVTNADNGCAIENWEEGATNSGIGFVIEQDEASLKGTLQGVAALALGLYIGTNEFEGRASDRHFDLVAYGTISRQSGGCTYTLNAKISGETRNDAISGTIEYGPAASENPECASVQCTSRQNFNGTRPPKPD